MSSTQKRADVKQQLKDKVHAEIMPAILELVEQLPDDLLELGDAEQAIRKGCLAVANKMLQSWTEQAVRKIEIPRCPICEKKMRHRGLKPCALITTIGQVDYRRPRYRCNDCDKEIYPHDAAVRFLSHGVSQPLAMVVARMGSERAFGRVVEDLHDDYYVRISKQLVEQITEHAGQHILATEDARRDEIKSLSPREQLIAIAPSSPSTDRPPCEIAVACCDGVMLHTREKPPYLQDKSKKGSDWREVRVANISVGNRLPPRKPVRDGKKKRRGHDFRMDVARSRSLARFESVADVGMDMYLAAVESGFFDAPLRCFISDGASWLRSIAEEHFPDAVMILDWFHVMEYIGELSNMLFGAGTRKASAWTSCRETELWEGRLVAVFRAVNRQREKTGWTKEQSDQLEKTRTYLRNNRDRMNYPEYRRLGLPIGSGRVEGLCKTLVEGRCKQSGMRNWRPRGAEGVLRLRAARHDATFKETWHRYFAPA